jgi:predicted ATP-binding protein involved in virulence
LVLELVYLWIEDYKNIHHQGFNFSPRFECGYDKDKNELTIDEKKDYKSIFPENINVTAIVGENGSGKSSVLEYIENNHFDFKIIKENENYNKKDSVTTKEIKLLKYSFTKIGENHFYDNFRTILNHDNQYFSYLNKDFFFNSYYIYTAFNFYEINKKSEYSIPINRDELEKFILFDILNVMKNKLLIRGVMGLSKEDYSKEEQEIDKLVNELENQIKNLNYSSVITKYQEIITKASKYNISTDDITIVTKNDVDDFLKLFKYDEDLKAFKSDNMEFTTNTDNKVLKYLRQRHYIKEEFIHKKFMQYSYQSLSSGEKHYLNLFTYIVSNIQNNKNINTILLDEPDIFLHPQWQKEFIKYLLLTMRKLGLQNIHIILTTHSPFLLSDLPKENIIFLNKDKDGNCKNVTKETNINTFGANIHTLLSNGFFMKDGLMGEFAKGKIDEVIKILNQNKLNDEDLKYCEQIISIIGEPIIKRQLEKMLHNAKIGHIRKASRITLGRSAGDDSEG